MEEKIIIPNGFKVGNYNDEYTGVTVIINESGAVGGCDCRGGAPGTHETDMLRSEKMMQKINAIALCGGSAYGLGTIPGIMEYLKEHKIGFSTMKKIVPICAGACIFDLNDKEYHYPTMEYGYKACENASNTPSTGIVGAATGATVGKIRGLKYSSKTGLGMATVKVAGITVTAVVVVNALGDIIDPFTNSILAGARDKSKNFINTEQKLCEGEFAKLFLGTNTTIGCVMTNAKITKVEANKLATIAHNGLARTIRPVHTDYDGDTMFCLSSNKVPVVNFVYLQTAVVSAVEKAIINSTNVDQEVHFEIDE